MAATESVTSRIVLGIDPGFVAAGYGIMHIAERKLSLIDHGALTQSSSCSISERLHTFYDFFGEKITAFGVTDLALETPFLGKNVQNFLKLGYLRGALLLLASQRSLVVHEFTPRQVKELVTGYGGADKEQVARMILNYFPSLALPSRFDITDAIGVALCGVWESTRAQRHTAGRR